MSPGLDRSAAAIFDFTAVKDLLSLVIDRFELDPHIKGINGAPGKEMAALSCSHDHFDADRIASTNRRINFIEGRDDLDWLRDKGLPGAEVRRFLANRKRACQLRLFLSRFLFVSLYRGRGRTGHPENVDRHLPVSKKILSHLHLLGVLVHMRQGGIRAWEPM